MIPAAVSQVRVGWRLGALVLVTQASVPLLQTGYRFRLPPFRFRAALSLSVSPLDLSHCRNARRTCSETGTPSRSLTVRSPFRMSGSIRNAARVRRAMRDV